MTEMVLSNVTASITELKTNPMKTVESGSGEAIAILNRNKPAFYCVPAEVYEALLESVDNAELVRLVKKRSGQKEIAVTLDDL